MSARKIWDGLSRAEQGAAISDRLPRGGYVFRAVISRKTKSGFIEYQDDDGWSTVCLAARNMRLKPKAEADT